MRIIFLLFFLTNALHAQVALDGYYVKNYNVKNGLPSNGCTSVAQDAQGFIWFGTYAGLVRSDGWGAMDIRPAAVNTIRIANKGSIYVATDGGLQINSAGDWQNKYEKDGLPSEKVEDIWYSESSGRLWIGTARGLCYMQGDSISQHGIPEALKSIQIYAILEASDGAMWFTTGHGLLKYTANEGLKRLGDFSVSYGLVEDGKGRIWAGRDAHGFKVLNRDGNEVDLVGDMGFGKEMVSAIDILPNGEIWLFGLHGVNRYAESGWLASVELPNAEPMGAMVASDGSIWVNTRRQGVYQFCRSNFKNISKPMLSGVLGHSLFERKDGSILVATESGVDVCRMVDGKLQTMPFIEANKLPSSYVKDAIEDRTGNVWIGTRKGLVKVAPDGKQSVYTTGEGLPHNYVRTFYEDSKGVLWIGTNNGLATMDSGRISAMWLEEGFSGGMILSISETRSGDIWVCGQQDLWRRQGGKWEKMLYLESGKTTNVRFRMQEDADGALWIPHNVGFARYKQGKFKLINASDFGIQNYSGGLFQIMEDGQGDFWIPSTIGVIRLSRKECNDFLDGKISHIRSRIFNTNHGMLIQECVANARHLVSSTGQLWFCTHRGISVFEEDAQKVSKHIPQAYPMWASIDGGEAARLPEGQAISLEAHQLNLRLGYASPDFIEPELIYFKYMLQGFEQRWTEVRERYISFTNFPSGSYTLLLVACNGEGICQPEPIKISIKKSPFWYENPVFIGLILLTLVVLIWLGVRARLMQLEQQKQRLTFLVDERTKEIVSQKANIEQAYYNVQLLSGIGKEVTHKLSVEDIIDTVYTEVNQLMPAEGFGIGIYNEKEGRIDFPGFIEKGRKLPFHYDELHNNDSLSDICFNQQKEIVINDMDAEIGTYLQERKVVAGENVSSLIYLPLEVKGRSVGNITVQSFYKHAYTDYHVNLLRNIATYVSIALDNAATYQSLDQEKEQSERLLLNILPYETAQELKSLGKASSKYYDQVTVLFTDFKDFTKLSQALSPNTLVHNLNYCFTAFDRIVKKHGLEKIKTIGDAYMAAGGIPQSDTDNHIRAMEAAFEINAFMEAWRIEQEAQGRTVWRVRIGLHTGPVVAGVVGENKFAYDIWGDTVNTASRVESASEPGKVNISEATYNLLKESDVPYRFTYRGEIEAKGKGMVGMYFVEKARAGQ